MTTKLKKPIALLLAVTMAMLLNFPSGMFGIDLGIKASAEEITPTEPKTDNGVYQIGSAAELYWFAKLVNGGTTNANAVLTADITVNSDLLGSLDDNGNVTNGTNFTAWTPIGYYNNYIDSRSYTGTFDGQGHTISGLYFNDTDTNYVGLFGYVGNGGHVLNVGVVDSYFSGWIAVGGVCGYNNFGTIENCYNTGSVNGNNSVGGVCGYNNSGTITNCYNEGTVSGSSGSKNVGGVCGNNYGTIENCYNTGTVSGSSGSENVGGVCGYNDGTITKCYYLKTETINKDINAIGNENSDTADKAESKTTTDFTEICGLVGYHSHQNGICILCGNYKPATLTTDKYDINGDDEPDEVYEISSAGQLYWFAKLVNGGETSANAVLTENITVNSNLLGLLECDNDGNVTNGNNFTSWTPIGSSTNKYIGTFDGQGHTISGLYFNDKYKEYVGLFGYVGEGGSVSNVGVVDSYFQGYDYVGGVCGDNHGTITNCYNTGTVSGSSSSWYVGGVCGFNDGTIESCYNTGSVSGSDYVGGVCGINYGTTKSCYNTGAVTGSGENVGGVCGVNIGTITYCYYLAESETDNIEDTTFKNTTEFASGEVAYLLQSAQTTVDAETGKIPMVWGQTIGTDAYPVFYKNNTVYYGYADCSAADKTYTNIQHDEYGHSYTGENHACSYCGNAFAVIEVKYAPIGTAVDTAHEVDANGTIGNKVDVNVAAGSNVITCAIALNGSEPAVDSYELKIFKKGDKETPLAETGKSKYKKILSGDTIAISIIQIVYDLDNATDYTVELTLYDGTGDKICTQETDYPQSQSE